MNSGTRMTKLALGVVIMFLAVGCKPTPKPPVAQPIDYAAELPPGQLALRKLSPGEYPDFSQAILAFNVPGLGRSIDNSLTYLAAPTSRGFVAYLDVDHDRAAATVVAVID